MTAPRLLPHVRGRADALLREIGSTFRRARKARGDKQGDLAAYFGMRRRSTDNISRFERGRTGARVDTAVRYLNLYGYTLRVARLKEGCGHECACSSKLYHDVSAVIARIDAPIAYPTLTLIRGELQAALHAADEEAL